MVVLTHRKSWKFIVAGFGLAFLMLHHPYRFEKSGHYIKVKGEYASQK